MLTAILTCGLMVTSCSYDDTPVQPQTDEVEALLQQMTLREKVGQLFYVRPEVLDTTIHWTTYDELMSLELQEVTERMKGLNEKYPVGGVILYAWNIKDETQLSRFISQIRALNGQPLLCIDEEGGRVARIANNDNFAVKKYESMEAIGATGDPQNAYECGNTIGTYLKLRGELGYQNIIITDAISMGAITNQYSNAEAAVGSIMAGADIVLDPRSYVEAFDAVFNAVNNGTITEERINQSVRRVLKLKRLYGLEYGK